MITTTTTTNVTGLLFDIYHIKDKAILWMKEDSGSVKKLEYPWPACVYVASEEKSELMRLLNNKQILSFIKEYEFVNRFEYPSSPFKIQVLKLILNDSPQINTLAKCIENLCTRFVQYRLYNVDISPEQSFLYEKDIYPLGLYNVKEKLEIQTNDLTFNIFIEEEEEKSNNNDKDKDYFEYVIPNFKFLSFDIISEKNITAKIANSMGDRIQAIVVNVFDKEKENGCEQNFIVSKDDESETLLEFSFLVKKLDPDIILTKGGDQFLFPQLLYRSKINKIDENYYQI